MTSWLAWRPTAPAPTPEQLVRATLRAVWDLHASYKDGSGAGEQWLWRGQASGDHRLEPAIHTRVEGVAILTDDHVVAATENLIEAARQAALDRHEETILPDVALLAMLQHHGAATPLLDVTLDPVVALYMSVVSPHAKDGCRDGALFAIRRPAIRWIEKFDSRKFKDVYNGLPTLGIAAYEAPDVSERLRIQRGLFLAGRVSISDNATIPFTFERDGDPATHWLQQRLNGRAVGRPPSARTNVAVFPIPCRIKVLLQEWLEARSGMTTDFVYPTRWHQPHFEQFAKSHGRKSDLTLAIP